jgi:hypothetical protein
MKKEVEGFILPDFKYFYKGIVMESAWCRTETGVEINGTGRGIGQW